MATIEKRINKKGEVSYRAKVRMLGHKAESATFTSLTKAKRWAQDTESAMRDGRHFKTAESKKHTLADAIDRYINDILPQKPKNAANTKSQLLWWKEQIGVKLLSDISPALIGEKRDKLLSEPIEFTKKQKQEDGTTKEIITKRRRSPATVVRYLAALSPVFTEAVKEWGWMETSPLQKVKKPKEPSGRVRFLSDDERDRLLEACKASGNKYLYPAVVIALATGARYSEILGLKWEDVYFDNRRIILRENGIRGIKNGETRAAPLTGLAYGLLKDLSKIRRIDSNLVFPSTINRGQKPILLRKSWETALESADIKDFRFHDLRHSCASYLAMNGASLAEIAEVLGHKTLQMVKRYAHLSESHTLGVVERMNQKIFGEQN